MNCLLLLNLALEIRRNAKTSNTHQDFSLVSLRTGNFTFLFLLCLFCCFFCLFFHKGKAKEGSGRCLVRILPFAHEK